MKKMAKKAASRKSMQDCQTKDSSEVSANEDYQSKNER